MIVWGSGGDVLNLGTIETRHCDICEKDRAFDLVLEYRYFGFYWIFNFVTRKKYLMLCSICQRGWELDAKKIESALKTQPVPFMRRFGCLVGIGVLALIIVLILLADAMK